ncbi:hypothetical protein NDU88_006150 [Pleurodeles waltl]|uniref:Secreted protein n=1 Tax=Pleurodeles waltl TaxID=8319 RepID=A0AAV7SNR8_PLEWA|nr:hypothetical protein NDU88_006150 [Pleurodeles waltl]
MGTRITSFLASSLAHAAPGAPTNDEGCDCRAVTVEHAVAGKPVVESQGDLLQLRLRQQAGKTLAHHLLVSFKG